MTIEDKRVTAINSLDSPPPVDWIGLISWHWCNVFCVYDCGNQEKVVVVQTI